MLWQTMSSAPCCLSSTTTLSWYLERAGLERLRPPRKSCNSMLSAARAPEFWTMFETDCFSPIQCLRSVTWIWVPALLLHWNRCGIKTWFKIILSHFWSARLLEMPKLWRMTTQAALENTWTSSLTTRWTETCSLPYSTNYICQYNVT